MSEQDKQWAEMLARTKPVYNTAIRSVDGGFVVTGATSYQNNTTGGFEFSKNDECVSTTPEDAAQKSLNYHRSGNFGGTVPAPAVTAAQPVADAAPLTI